ncbi:glyoxalase-like domain protein [Burkholderia ambifaria AMMD]|uniref:Glyoxalase/bleomycin resistance protein/dioxygenase n=1 Tax=Burkholderia ambifaria (strain ATCC BAA-244 / DSM 16087 / CCUG 44356 / LMG 19182 / AMMD) TaxID=339670 RepID=Q0BF91_BURCM|nr:VOC family protein [Burkholderia ambifaria]ABI87182.1 Glyoxalase/bleomycin resistance protein/dioxygenase [Burkholderia ambifaria AMMD]AJY21400.1 glyoxalase-like domain protein [Burkholderia ambifaria AMMD]MBR7928671.1 VOC family protein [Burkholderia ambifaria]PEH65596.1 VOC family protein [Burkholderia ambifaria]QQC05598.1 VOC family protein [Burkholderia ambifaria]
MLVFELINLDASAADAERLTCTLSAQCTAAGYSLRPPQTDGCVPDGVFMLSRSASTAAHSECGRPAGRTAAAQIRIDATGHAAEAPAIWPGSNVGAFCYPFALVLKTADASPEVARDWLASFATFTACIKMWRRLRDAAEQCRPLELRVNHVNILARDLTRSVDFYRRILGASYCYNLGPKKVVMELNGFDLFIEQANTVAYPPGYHIGVRADPEGVKTIAARVEAGGGIRVVKGNGPAPGYHVGPDRVRTAFYFQDPDGLEIEVYSPEIEMLESNPQLISQHLP